jgi:5-methylcytosine-specific restriction endonuclease McrA
MKIRKLSWKWWKAVLERDAHKCVNCESTSDLEVHHKIPLVKIMKDYNINSLEEAKICKLLFDIANGETLCEKCHLVVTIEQIKTGVTTSER